MDIATNTTVLAAQGIVGMAQELFKMVVIVGTIGAMALGIFLAFRAGVKQGIGAAIGAVVGGIILSLIIANAAGFQESGNQELQERGVVVSPYGR